jgi:cysteine desulfurase
MKNIYLDSAAHYPIYPEVFSEIQKLQNLKFGNPSSIHQYGQEAKALIDEARYESAQCFECNISEIIFTSGATESLNLAIIGNYLAQKKQLNFNKKTIIVSPLVHDAIIRSLNFLKQHFDIHIKYLPINTAGFIDVENIPSNFFKNSISIICEHGNSEIGHLQPVAKLGKLIKKYKKETGESNIVFIVDAAASILTENISLKRQVCDFISISAEKIGGFSGQGILIKKDNTQITPLINGSAELGYRGGTENLIGITSLKKTLEINNHKKDSIKQHFEKLQNFTQNFFIKKFPKIKITTPKENNLNHIFHFLLAADLEANLFVQLCDFKNIQISAGSACASGTINGSRILKKLNYTHQQSRRGVRISFSEHTTLKELRHCFNIFDEIFNKN